MGNLSARSTVASVTTPDDTTPPSVTLTAPAQAAPALDLEARAAVLMDFETGQVLYEKNPDEPISPASLTKLMTLHLAFKRIEAGQMRLEDPVVVSENAWAANFPDSSLMFLEPGDKVTVVVRRDGQELTLEVVLERRR